MVGMYVPTPSRDRSKSEDEKDIAGGIPGVAGASLPVGGGGVPGVAGGRRLLSEQYCDIFR